MPEENDTPLGGIAVREGLSWSWHLDLDALVAALSEPAPWNRLPPPADAEPADAEPTDAQPTETEPTDAQPTDAGPSEVGLPGPSADPVEADFAGYLDAVGAGRSSVVPLPVAAGRVAEILPAGPDLAAWLALNPAAGLEDGALAGAAAAY
ncbi:MAG TPA: hypothetical protein VMR14_00950, partial [Streptosporangiaceae bacterium]|nr:hypothetical protein [Streptosporangiaceae bacterium]